MVDHPPDDSNALRMYVVRDLDNADHIPHCCIVDDKDLPYSADHGMHIQVAHRPLGTHNDPHHALVAGHIYYHFVMTVVRLLQVPSHDDRNIPNDEQW